MGHRRGKVGLVGGMPLAVALVLVGCGGGTTLEEPSGQVASPIVGGELTTGFPYVVAFLNSGLGRCTGTLIAPNLVLTARHCVDVQAGDAGNCAEAKFLPTQDQDLQVLACADVRDRNACAARFTVDHVVRTPGTAMCGNDMALLVLSALIPADVATPIEPRVSGPIYGTSLNRAFTAIGYGVTDLQMTGGGIKRIREDIRIECIPGHPTLRFACADMPQRLSEREFLAGEGTCHGDSGSAALEQGSFNRGEPLILGVLSRGEERDGKCGLSATYTRTDAWKDFLVDNARKAAKRGGYPVPAWARLGLGEKPPGTACDKDGDCASGMCASNPDEDGSICVDVCGAAPCVAGTYCLDGSGLVPSTCPGEGAPPDVKSVDPTPDPMPPSPIQGRCAMTCPGGDGPASGGLFVALASGLLFGIRRRRGTRA